MKDWSLGPERLYYLERVWAARLTVLDGVNIGDGSDNLQQVCISALGSNWF